VNDSKATKNPTRIIPDVAGITSQFSIINFGVPILLCLIYIFVFLSVFCCIIGFHSLSKAEFKRDTKDIEKNFTYSVSLCKLFFM
jgi:hypothetical protein